MKTSEWKHTVWVAKINSSYGAVGNLTKVWSRFTGNCLFPQLLQTPTWNDFFSRDPGLILSTVYALSTISFTSFMHTARHEHINVLIVSYPPTGNSPRFVTNSLLSHTDPTHRQPQNVPPLKTRKYIPQIFCFPWISCVSYSSIPSYPATQRHWKRCRSSL